MNPSDQSYVVPESWKQDIIEIVSLSIKEDIKDGDITAQLKPKNKQMKTAVITREHAVLCGKDWVNETFSQIDPTITITWFYNDGNLITPNDVLFTAEGNARSILSAERIALNFLQLLSGTATTCRQYSDTISHTTTSILDTRKTIPGLRTAQKYASLCGNCHNHRIGLYDAFLIKENHIAACGSIIQAVNTARSNHPSKPIEVETETLNEVKQALQAKADRIMLDDFSIEDIRKAVELCQGKCELEVSSNVTLDTLQQIAETGVDFISSGALTKHCKAIDLSMRFTT